MLTVSDAELDELVSGMNEATKAYIMVASTGTWRCSTMRTTTP